MQKVEGSSPFIRFTKALGTGPFCCQTEHEGLSLQAELQAG